MDEFYGGIQVAFEYQRSFHGSRLANCLFGTNTLSFKGSQVVGRNNSRDLVADYFGLPVDFSGTLRVRPLIENFNAHFQTFMGFDNWAEGLYGIINMTVAHQRRTLFDDGDCCATSSVTTTSTSFPAGYMAAGAISPITSLKAALAGVTTWGEKDTPMQYGKFRFCKKGKTGVANLDLILGYDFIRKECYRLGFYVKAVAPTGTKLDASYAEYIFNPMVGNGARWELGGGIYSHAELWSNDDDKSFMAYLEGYVGHVFKRCQVRSFDLAGDGCLSRYMLLKELLLTGTTYSYNGHLINAINFSTRNVDASIPVKGDASLKFVFRVRNWDMGVGYNIYGQSREKLDCIKCSFPCGNAMQGNLYGVKGCAGNYYLAAPIVGGSIAASTATSDELNATQSTATAYSCGVVDNAAVIPNTATVAVFAYNSNGNNVGPVSLATGGTAAALESPTNGYIAPQQSVPAVETTCPASFNRNTGRAPKQLTHKIFGTLDYTWADCDWSPFLGLGGEGEFASSSDRCSVNQWGVWIKGGVSY